MIRSEQIPPEVEAAIWATLQRDGGATMAEALAAGLNAWPGMRVDDTYRWLSDVAIILPMENVNAES